MGKQIIIIGLIIVLLGIIIVIFQRLNITNIPGNFYFKKGNFSFYFPLTFSIIASVVISIIIYLISRR